MGADPIAAARAVTANIDESTRMKACRAIMRNAVAQCCIIGAGAVIENVEEIDFHDDAERALQTYLKVRRAGAEAGRQFRGASASIHAIADKMLEEAMAAEAAKARPRDPADNSGGLQLGGGGEPLVNGEQPPAGG